VGLILTPDSGNKEVIMTRQDIEEATGLVKQILKKDVFPAIASLKTELLSAIETLKAPAETEQDKSETSDEGGA